MVPSTARMPGPGGRLPTPQGVAFIRSCEGFSSGAYVDSMGNCTIGYGHLIHLGAVMRLTGLEPLPVLKALLSSTST